MGRVIDIQIGVVAATILVLLVATPCRACDFGKDPGCVYDYPPTPPNSNCDLPNNCPIPPPTPPRQDLHEESQPSNQAITPN